MKEYYAMIGGDYEGFILINKDVCDFLTIAHCDLDDEEITELRESFSDETWKFIKEEFNATDTDDVEFIKSLSEDYHPSTSNSFRQFSALDSTYFFSRISDLVKFVKENDINVIRDYID